VQVNHLSNSLRSGKQSSIDGCGSLERPHIDNQIDEGIEIGNRASIAHFGALNAERLGLTVDAFTGSALGIDGMIKRTGAIEQGTHQPTFLPIGVFDTALAEGLLGMRTGLSRRCGQEQRAAKALGAKAVGVLELVDGVHAQAC
jgi:hypothetical protein